MPRSIPVCVYNPDSMTWWAPKLPDAILDFSLDITDSIDETQDFPISATCAVSPSGAGEMFPTNLYIETVEICGCPHTILTATMNGGQPSRTYMISFDVLMSSNRFYQFIVNQEIPTIIPGAVATVPPSPDFCSPISAIGGAGNPVISYTGNPTGSFQFVTLPSIGTYLNGALSYLGPTIDFVGNDVQNGLLSLTVTNATTYLDTFYGFTMVASSMTSFSMPNMTTWIGPFSPVMVALTTLNLPALQSATGGFAPSFASLTTMSLPALLTVSGTFSPTVPNLLTFSMNAGLESFSGNFEIVGASLVQSSVDGILVSLSLLNGSGNTSIYNGAINLSGGTSATPSSIGLAAKALLIGQGATVTTN